MTEQEWLNSTDPNAMMSVLLDARSARKARLSATACCYLISDLLPHGSLWAVEVVERYADGLATSSELDTAMNVAQKAWHMAYGPPESQAAHAAYVAALIASSKPFPIPVGHVLNIANKNDQPAMATRLATLLRDIFGNPFRSVALNPVWRTSTVHRLSQAIYDAGAYDRMPIVADALEESGCSNREILDHCRGPGPHFRGCWVVDLILGKE